jgi:hypothetical protein
MQIKMAALLTAVGIVQNEKGKLFCLDFNVAKQ